MGMYNVIFTDTGLQEKTIIRGTSGLTGILQMGIKDENGAAVDLTGLTVVGKIYVGVEGTLKINADVTSVTAGTGLVTYNIAWDDFSADTDTGTFEVELYFADNVVATKSITASGASLKVIKSMVD